MINNLIIPDSNSEDERQFNKDMFGEHITCTDIIRQLKKEKREQAKAANAEKLRVKIDEQQSMDSLKL